MSTPTRSRSRQALIAVSSLLAIGAIPSSWVGLQRYRQNVFVQTVEATGGKCTFEETGEFWLPNEVTIANIEETSADPEVTNRAIAAAAELVSLRAICVQVHSSMTEKRLSLLCALGKLPKLHALILRGERGSEVQLARIRMALKEHVHFETAGYKGVEFDPQKFRDEMQRLKKLRIQ